MILLPTWLSWKCSKQTYHRRWDVHYNWLHKSPKQSRGLYLRHRQFSREVIAVSNLVRQQDVFCGLSAVTNLMIRTQCRLEESADLSIRSKKTSAPKSTNLWIIQHFIQCVCNASRSRLPWKLPTETLFQHLAHSLEGQYISCGHFELFPTSEVSGEITSRSTFKRFFPRQCLIACHWITRGIWTLGEQFRQPLDP